MGAILDNFYWLTNTSYDLKYELTQLNYNVHNYSVDETKVNDIFTGIVPNKTLVASKKYPYLEKVKQLDILANKFNKNYNLKSMIVLSIGGNDLKAKSKT